MNLRCAREADGVKDWQARDAADRIWEGWVGLSHFEGHVEDTLVIAVAVHWREHLRNIPS